MAIKVDHIADVSFVNHFLDGDAPVDGKITVMGARSTATRSTSGLSTAR